jgi:beta-lactam-binding protein with PASTA domain
VDDRRGRRRQSRAGGDRDAVTLRRPAVLGAARGSARSLRRAHCRFGRISHKCSRKGKRGRVIAQSPRAGARKRAGTGVKMTLRR